VVVAFTLDPGGRLLEAIIVSGSGQSGLDRAALDLLREAEPFPGIPDAMRASTYRVEMPIRYAIE